MMNHQPQEARLGSGDQGRIKEEAVSEKNSEAFLCLKSQEKGWHILSSEGINSVGSSLTR